MPANLVQESKHLSPLLSGNINSFVMLDSTIWLATENQLFSLSKDELIPQLTTELSGNIEFLTSDNTHIYLITDYNKLYQYHPASAKLTEHTSWQTQANFDYTSPINHFNGQIWYLNELGQLASYHLTDNLYQTFNAFGSSFTAFHIDINANTNNSSNTSVNNNLANNSATNNSATNNSANSSANSLANNSAHSPHIWLTTSNNQVMLFNINNQSYQSLNIEETANFSIENTSSINSNTNTIILGSKAKGCYLLKNSSITIQNTIQPPCIMKTVYSPIILLPTQ
jgi:hypothetical protein